VLVSASTTDSPSATSVVSASVSVATSASALVSASTTDSPSATSVVSASVSVATSASVLVSASTTDSLSVTSVVSASVAVASSSVSGTTTSDHVTSPKSPAAASVACHSNSDPNACSEAAFSSAAGSLVTDPSSPV
jgi:hypothetical protein